jgi:hypothetical protein
MDRGARSDRGGGLGFIDEFHNTDEEIHVTIIGW